MHPSVTTSRRRCFFLRIHSEIGLLSTPWSAEFEPQPVSEIETRTYTRVITHLVLDYCGFIYKHIYMRDPRGRQGWRRGCGGLCVITAGG